MIAKNFNLTEFSCPCCKAAHVSMVLIEALQRYRDLVSKPVIVTSGYRCKAHNKHIGGAKNSKHVSGEAADIWVAGMDVKQLYQAALEIPEFLQGGIGVYDSNFIHVDVRDKRARWSRINGKYGKLIDLLGYDSVSLEQRKQNINDVIGGDQNVEEIHKP